MQFREGIRDAMRRPRVVPADDRYRLSQIHTGDDRGIILRKDLIRLYFIPRQLNKDPDSRLKDERDHSFRLPGVVGVFRIMFA